MLCFASGNWAFQYWDEYGHTKPHAPSRDRHSIFTVRNVTGASPRHNQRNEDFYAHILSRDQPGIFAVRVHQHFIAELLFFAAIAAVSVWPLISLAEALSAGAIK